MEENSDWRLTNQIAYLNRKQLKHIQFQPYSDKWDHEHCEFCMKKLVNVSEYGYCTLDNYYWICEDCYNDFKEMFHWTIS